MTKFWVSCLLIICGGMIPLLVQSLAAPQASIVRFGDPEYPGGVQWSTPTLRNVALPPGAIVDDSQPMGAQLFVPTCPVETFSTYAQMCVKLPTRDLLQPTLSGLRQIRVWAYAKFDPDEGSPMEGLTAPQIHFLANYGFVNPLSQERTFSVKLIFEVALDPSTAGQEILFALPYFPREDGLPVAGYAVVAAVEG